MRSMTEGVKMQTLQFYENLPAQSSNVSGTMCVVTNHQKQLLLQYRDHTFKNFPNCLSHFGGAIDSDETSEKAIIRELSEELGAQALPEDLIFLGCLSEEETQHSELVNTYYWHDKSNTITGCYEGELRTYSKLNDVLSETALMTASRWMIEECQRRNLI